MSRYNFSRYFLNFPNCSDQFILLLPVHWFLFVSLSPTHATFVSFWILAVVSEHYSDCIVVLICISLMVNGRRQWHPTQYSCLENPMDGGAWWAAVQGVAKSQTRLSNFTFTFHFHALEKEMATHSTVFAWRIPGTGEPGGLPSLGSHRVGHDWSDH